MASRSVFGVRGVKGRVTSSLGPSTMAGCASATNRFPVENRMKRGGQRRGPEGGQAVLSFRAPVKSDRLEAM